MSCRLRSSKIPAMKMAKIIRFLAAYNDRKAETRNSFRRHTLSAQNLIDIMFRQTNFVKGYFVDKAIEEAAFILECIDK